MRTQICTLLEELSQNDVQAKKIIDRCEEAYRASTTQGLASAFAARAKELKDTTNYWSLFLVICLLTATAIGSHRVTYIQELINKGVNTNIIVTSALLSMFVLAAPVWLSWLATKQISQRFRLSEDYAFKASFAKAYEGYRREAINLDQNLAKRLFEAAINRMDESPVRLIDQNSPGSPLHDLLSAKANSPVNATETRVRPD